jgi:hypothetical protein
MFRVSQTFILAFVLTAALARVPRAQQSRVGSDSATRLTRLGRDAVYGTLEGFAFSGLDQYNRNPPEWGNGWTGFRKRVASNLGEFYIQEGVAEGLAAAMDRPLDYTPCHCRPVADRVTWAVRGAVTDRLSDGTHAVAVPRIAGAYVGSFAQASWRPVTGHGRVWVALVNGTTSLGFGALINLYHEFRHSGHPAAAR